MRERTGVTFIEMQSHIPSLMHDWERPAFIVLILVSSISPLSIS